MLGSPLVYIWPKVQRVPHEVAQRSPSSLSVVVRPHLYDDLTCIRAITGNFCSWCGDHDTLSRVFLRSIVIFVRHYSDLIISVAVTPSSKDKLTFVYPRKTTTSKFPNQDPIRRSKLSIDINHQVELNLMDVGDNARVVFESFFISRHQFQGPGAGRGGAIGSDLLNLGTRTYLS
jgi:hypothetical protein